MPASAGRVRMPHNNRMSTSASLKSTAIWQKTIGHDPYANANEADGAPGAGAAAAPDAEKVKSVMELARSQNVTGGANRDDFTARMYLGLKRGKQHAVDASKPSGDAVAPIDDYALRDPSSSSEDEFVYEPDAVEKPEEMIKKDKTKKKKSRKSKRRRREDSSEDVDDESDDSESTDDSPRRERRRRKREKRSRKKHSRKRSRRESDSSDDESDHERRRRRRKRDERSRSRRDRDRSRDRDNEKGKYKDKESSDQEK